MPTEPASAWTDSRRNWNAPVAPWTRDPEAKRLLASLVARPPRFEHHTNRYALTSDELVRAIGTRAARLEAIRFRFLDFAVEHRRRDLFALNQDVSVVQAILDAQDAADALECAA